MTRFQALTDAHLPAVEQEMLTFISEHTTNERLKEAMVYSIEAGGKRFRPALVVASVATFGKPIATPVYQVASALEFVHTYSLIHDDLPAMDDDDLRRGQPTNHKVFGEAHAILAGDGLLTAAFELLAVSQVASDEKVLLLQLLAKAAGTAGMVAGQAGDLQGETQQLTLDELIQVHNLKTGALIRYALVAGGILAQQPTKVIELLDLFGQHLGLAFQIRDDLLDATSSEEALGKKVGRDQALNKSTYPALLGLAGTKEALAKEVAACHAILLELKSCRETADTALFAELLAQF